jgi:branched-chain amino acid transport system permease protein
LTTRIIQYIVDAFSFGSVTALTALGISLIFGVMRMMNFAHGELIMAGAYLILMFGGLPTVPALIASVVGVIVLALIMERVAFRPLRNADFTTLLVSSLTVSYFLQNLVSILTGAVPRGFNLVLSNVDFFTVGSIRISATTVITAAISSVAIVALWVFLKRTSIGTQMRASADNFKMARLLGVRANIVIATAFALSGLLAGLVSITMVAQTGQLTYTMGTSAVLTGFVAAVIGGMGSLGGAVAGGFIFGFVTVAFQLLLPSGGAVYRDVFVYGVVILALMFRPEGIFVRRSSARERV